MSTTTLFPIASLLVFALSTQVICDTCEVNDLPEFRDIPGHRLEDGLDGEVSAIVPSYTFSCAGHVAQWRAHVEGRRSRYDRYVLTFSVWRRLQTNEFCSLVKIGENSHPGRLAPETDASNSSLGTVTLNVNKGDQILVEPGDFVGFWVRHYEGEGEMVAGAASILTDVNRTDVVVYMSTTPLSSHIGCVDQRSTNAWDIEGIPRRITAAVLAPVITMEILPAPVSTTTTLPFSSIPISSSTTSAAYVSTSTANSITMFVHPAVSITADISPTVSHSIITSATISTPPIIIPTKSVTSTTASADETATDTTIIIIIIASLLVLMVVLVLMLLFSLLCAVAARRKKHPAKAQDDSDNGTIEMIQNRVYSIHNSYTMPEYYKREEGRYPGYSAVYDTVYTEPLPRLNPALSSSSAEGPALLSHSESTSSQGEGYELLYSVLQPPFHSTSTEEIEQCSGIACPLYLSTTSHAESNNVYDVPVQDHTYNVLTRPDGPPYEVPTMKHEDESSLDREFLEREDYLIPSSRDGAGSWEATYEEVPDVNELETTM